MKNILVTGGTGFIGVHLVKRLNELGHKLKLLVRETSDTSCFEGLDNIEYVIGDVTDIDSIYKGAENVDCIYHLAGYVKIWAKDRNIYERINVDGAENAAKVALDKDIPMYYVSSFGAIGPNKDGNMCDEETQHDDFFHFEYEKTKFLGTEVVKDYMAKGLKAVIFYPGFIYGPGDFNIYGEMMFDIVAGQFLGCPGKGDSLFCMAYIDDVVDGMVKALGRDDLIGEDFFLGGENIEIGKYLDLAAEVAGTKKPRHFPMSAAILYANVLTAKANFGKPKRVPYITKPMLVGMKVNWAYSSQKAIDKLGYKITPLREGLETTVKWYQDYIEKHGKKKKKVGIRCSII